MHPNPASTCLAATLLAAAFGAPAMAASSAATLAFADFYQQPVGPRGLTPTPTLLALAGARVQITGFVVPLGDPASGPALLAPLPVRLADEDESLADELPPAVAYLHPVRGGLNETLLACHGTARVEGRLELGPMAEPDGRLSFVRLRADAAECSR